MSESKSGLNTPFDQSTRYERKRLHLGVCGSVACYKAADLLRAWAGMGIHVSATLTPGARRQPQRSGIRGWGNAAFRQVWEPPKVGLCQYQLRP